MRPIDADALLSQVKRSREKNPYIGWMLGTLNAVYDFTHRDVLNLINSAPTIDAKPMRHGQWIPKKVDAIETEFQCSECGRTVECGNDYFGKPTKHVSSTFPYCHCGAKMDLEVQHAEERSDS